MVKTQEITDKKVWEDFVFSRTEANFLQSWNWGDFHKKLGHQITRTGFYDSDQLVGIMLSIVEKAKRGTYLTVPGGPLIDWQSKEITKEFKTSIIEISKRFKCVFVRVRPQILETLENAKLFSDLGFVSAPMHLHAELTRQLDLTKDEALLLADMRKATRYEIKQAQRLEIRIETSMDIEDFYNMQMETARRQKFVPFGHDFLQKQFEVFAHENNVIIYTAWFGKIKLAQAFVIFYGREADYHYGVSNENGRKYPGAYLIQWEAIKEAKRRGMKRYNLWGVAPEGEKLHRFHGVSVFKRGFGGEDVAYLHARDLVINGPRYLLNYLIETFRKRVRKV